VGTGTLARPPSEARLLVATPCQGETKSLAKVRKLKKTLLMRSARPTSRFYLREVESILLVSGDAVNVRNCFKVSAGSERIV
jgi:hypothetical protein